MVGKWLTEERSYNAIQIRYDLARQHPTQLLIKRRQLFGDWEMRTLYRKLFIIIS